jgi:poly-gamma-glutamate synthesis protein (capsule biosynthesis protein)
MTIKLLCLGDVMAGENIYHYKRGILSKYGNQYSRLISPDVHSLFVGIDLLFYNFEYSLVPSNFHFSELSESVYCAPDTSLSIFSNKIPRVVNVANNHFSQHGCSRADYTKRVLRDKGVWVVGANNHPVVIPCHNKKIHFWGASLVPDSKFCGCYFKSDYRCLPTEIVLPSSKRNDERWFISLHWGSEYRRVPDPQQRRLAVELVEMGIDVIIGHHPHVIQPFEMINGKPVFYSLGNFIFDQNFSKPTQQGLATKFTLEDDRVEIAAYVTKQSAYRVIQVEPYVPTLPMDTECEGIINRFRMRYAPFIMRLKMKWEVIRHFQDVDFRVVSFLFRRRF